MRAVVDDQMFTESVDGNALKGVWIRHSGTSDDSCGKWNVRRTYFFVPAMGLVKWTREEEFSDPAYGLKTDAKGIAIVTTP